MTMCIEIDIYFLIGCTPEKTRTGGKTTRKNNFEKCYKLMILANISNNYILRGTTKNYILSSGYKNCGDGN